MSWFIFFGALALVAGLPLLVTGIREHKTQDPKHVAMLIGGMMLTALGLFFTGFAIAWQHAAPLDLNAGGVK